VSFTMRFDRTTLLLIRSGFLTVFVEVDKFHLTENAIGLYLSALKV
jgi:hypothetical protein